MSFAQTADFLQTNDIKTSSNLYRFLTVCQQKNFNCCFDFFLNLDENC